METLPPSQEPISDGGGGARLLLGKRSGPTRCFLAWDLELPAALVGQERDRSVGLGLCPVTAPDRRVQASCQG